MDVRLPDGTLLTNVPDGMSQEDLLGHLQLAQHPAATSLMKQMAAKQTAEDTSPGGRFIAGQGLGFANLGRAAKQMVGMGKPNENAQIDRELLRTPSGFAGNLTTGIATAAPLSVVPGANTIGGAAAVGGAMGAFQPADSAKDRLINMGVGGVLGGGTQAAATVGARKLGEWGASRQARASELKAQNSVRDATLKEAQEAGYVIPPSAVNPSGTNKVIESIAGKAAVSQDASIRNQQVTNDLARKALGLPPNTALSEEALKGYRRTAGQPYRDVSSLSDEASAALETLKDARFQANAFQKHYHQSADPNSLAQAKNYSAAADALEGRLEEIATQSGRPELVEALRGARKQIAKSWDVERALNVGTGDVSARLLGKALDKGRPLTGELATAGRFAEAFSPYAREGAGIPTPNVSKTAALVGALMGGGGGAALGPGGMAAAAVPFVVPPAARNLALSKPFQKTMAQPKYSAGMTANAVAPLANEESRRRLALMARSLALPSVPFATPSN